MLGIGSARPALREDFTQEINQEIIAQFWNRRRTKCKRFFFCYLPILPLNYKMIFVFFFWQEFSYWRSWAYWNDQDKDLDPPSSWMPVQLISLEYPRWMHCPRSLIILLTQNTILKMWDPVTTLLRSPCLHGFAFLLKWDGIKSWTWFLLLQPQLICSDEVETRFRATCAGGEFAVLERHILDTSLWLERLSRESLTIFCKNNSHFAVFQAYQPVSSRPVTRDISDF